MRAFVLAMAILSSAPGAVAHEPSTLVGEWTTEWANAAGEAPTGGGPLIIRADDNPDSLDGLTPASGWDGVMTGAVTHEDGHQVWSGRWASIWPEGATTGTFRLVFSDADTFTGTWSSDDGEIREAAWIGRRAR